MNRLATLLSVTAILLGLLSTAQAQSTVSIPLGSLNITATPPPPPPPPAFTQQVSQAINTTVTINGAQYTATGTLAGTLTFTPVVPTTNGTTTGSTTGGGTSGGGTSGGGTTPAPAPGAITGVVNTVGVAVTTANGGTVVTIQGTNLGVGGTVLIASLPTTIMSWTPTAITVTLAKPGGSVGSPIVVTPTGGAPITSGFVFTITFASGTLPSNLSGPQPWMFVTGFLLKDGTLYPKVDPKNPWVVVPGSIVAGDPLTIVGQNFGTMKPGCRVDINSISVPILSWSDSAIRIQTSASGLHAQHGMSCLVWRDSNTYHLTKTDITINPKA